MVKLSVIELKHTVLYILRPIMKTQSKFLKLCVYKCGCTHVVAHVSWSGHNFLESLLTKLLFLKDLPVSATDCIRSTDIADVHHPIWLFTWVPGIKLWSHLAQQMFLLSHLPGSSKNFKKHKRFNKNQSNQLLHYRDHNNRIWAKLINNSGFLFNSLKIQIAYHHLDHKVYF